MYWGAGEILHQIYTDECAEVCIHLVYVDRYGTKVDLDMHEYKPNIIVAHTRELKASPLAKVVARTFEYPAPINNNCFVRCCNRARTPNNLLSFINSYEKSQKYLHERVICL